MHMCVYVVGMSMWTLCRARMGEGEENVVRARAGGIRCTQSILHKPMPVCYPQQYSCVGIAYSQRPFNS